jgi:porin
LRGSEGKLAIVEAGFSAGDGSYKLGYWNHSADITVGARRYGNDYGVIDQALLHLDGDSLVAVFMQYGWAPAARNSVTRYIGGGLHMHGLIPGRGEDDIGIAVARASTHQVVETTLELTYRLTLAPWLAIQPSLQLIRNPGGDAVVPVACVGQLRFEIGL